MSTDKEVRLFRDSVNTAWGFRLAGGKDIKQALHIQKVSLGSSAHGELEAGDLLLAIQSVDTGNLTHSEAQDIIKKAGGSLLLKIKRNGFHGQHKALLPSYSQSQTYFRQPNSNYMLMRVQDTLSGAILDRASRFGHQVFENNLLNFAHLMSSQEPLSSVSLTRSSPPKLFKRTIAIEPPEFGVSYVLNNRTSSSPSKETLTIKYEQPTNTNLKPWPQHQCQQVLTTQFISRFGGYEDKSVWEGPLKHVTLDRSIESECNQNTNNVHHHHHQQQQQQEPQQQHYLQQQQQFLHSQYPYQISDSSPGESSTHRDNTNLILSSYVHLFNFHPSKHHQMLPSEQQEGLPDGMTSCDNRKSRRIAVITEMKQRQSVL